MSRTGQQIFKNSVHNGVELQLNNLLPYAITWGDVKSVLLGLLGLNDCLEWLCDFEFSVDSGVRIGKGALRKSS